MTNDQRLAQKWINEFWRLAGMPSDPQVRNQQRWMLTVSFLAGLKQGRDEVYTDESLRIQEEQEAETA